MRDLPVKPLFVILSVERDNGLMPEQLVPMWGWDTILLQDQIREQRVRAIDIRQDPGRVRMKMQIVWQARDTMGRQQQQMHWQ